MLRRMRRLKIKGAMNFTTIKTKTERRDVVRMEKAEQRAQVEAEIEKQLLERLKNGTYGELYEDLVNLNPKAFKKHMENEEIEEEESMNLSMNSEDMQVNLLGNRFGK